MEEFSSKLRFVNRTIIISKAYLNNFIFRLFIKIYQLQFHRFCIDFCNQKNE